MKLEKTNLELDFRATEAFKILALSKKLRDKYETPLNIFVEAKEFINLITKNIKEMINYGEIDYWTLIFGYEGSGKSFISLALLSELLNKKLNKIVANTIFLQNEYLKLVNYFIENNIKKEPIVIDDAHFVFGKYNFLTKETAFLLELIRFIRDQQIIHILNTQTPTQLFSDVWLERINNYVYAFREKIYHNNEFAGFIYYVCAWIDAKDIKNNIQLFRDVANWKEILKFAPPDFITITNNIYNKYEIEYNLFKKVKQFYKRFLTFFRLKGYIKASEFEKFLEVIYLITEYLFYADNDIKFLLFRKIKHLAENDEDISKFISINEENQEILIDTKLNNIIFDFRDIIKERYRIFSRL